MPQPVAVAFFTVFASLLFHFLIFWAYGLIHVEEHRDISFVDDVENKLGIFSILVLGKAWLGDFPLPILGIPLAISLSGAWLTLRELRLQPALFGLGISTLSASFGPIVVHHMF
ncbi:hypothetical protein SAMN02745716_1155 [Thermoleophilum album]|uniref:Uncharacterized protein n=1 Tax=Thermoleophilum album TaxID=29539 RepID=A0A1H6FQZ9_THEAL|nr:hypothetical protein SAMN02745716_1155 [Thermoleophilum album]